MFQHYSFPPKCDFSLICDMVIMKYTAVYVNILQPYIMFLFYDYTYMRYYMILLELFWFVYHSALSQEWIAIYDFKWLVNLMKGALPGMLKSSKKIFFNYLLSLIYRLNKTKK